MFRAGPWTPGPGPHAMKYLIANWKMNLTAAQARELAAALGPAARPGLRVIVAPPFTALEAVAGTLAGDLDLAAQNIYPADDGAFTGEIGGEQLEEFSVRWLLAGHSERRKVLGESDAFIRQKINFALSRKINPVICAGETLAERESGRIEAVIAAQLAAALEGLQIPGGAAPLLAYEPVWAIGTGIVATPEQAAAVHEFIRNESRRHLNRALPVLYGGSVAPETIGSLIQGANCDGFLVGGASLQAESFLALANACNEAIGQQRW